MSRESTELLLCSHAVRETDVLFVAQAGLRRESLHVSAAGPRKLMGARYIQDIGPSAQTIVAICVWHRRGLAIGEPRIAAITAISRSTDGKSSTLLVAPELDELGFRQAITPISSTPLIWSE